MLLTSKKTALEMLQQAGDNMPKNAHVQHARFVNWYHETANDLATIFGDTSQAFKDFRAIKFVPSQISVFQKPDDVREQIIKQAYGNGMDAAGASLRAYTRRVQNYVEPETLNETKARTTAPALSRKVFIVHGHSMLKHAVERYLKSLKLEGIILAEQPNQGRTLIEKLEGESAADFVVVLATADDLAESAKALSGQDPIPAEALKAQARQNVIFELAYFVGKLGRSKVALVLEHGVHLPSDFQGVVWIDAEHWQKGLLRELGKLYTFDAADMHAAMSIE